MKLLTIQFYCYIAFYLEINITCFSKNSTQRSVIYQDESVLSATSYNVSESYKGFLTFKIFEKKKIKRFLKQSFIWTKVIVFKLFKSLMLL